MSSNPLPFQKPWLDSEDFDFPGLPLVDPLFSHSAR